MKRRLARPLAALLLGVLSTLAAAWALPWAAIHARHTRWDAGGWALNPGAWGADLWWADTGQGGAAARAGHYSVREHPLITTVNMKRIIFTGALEEKPFFRRNPPPSWTATISTDMREGFEQVVTSVTGWPFRCFRGEHWVSWREAGPAPTIVKMGDLNVPLGPTPAPGEVRRGVWSLSDPADPAVELPYLPMWPGLLANVGVFALAWLVLLYAPRGLRRYARARRGRCPACGYARAGISPDAPCPECGAAKSTG